MMKFFTKTRYRICYFVNGEKFYWECETKDPTEAISLMKDYFSSLNEKYENEMIVLVKDVPDYERIRNVFLLIIVFELFAIYFLTN